MQCAPVAARPSPHALDVVPFVSAVGFEKGSAWERGSAVTLQLVMEMGMRRLGGGGSSQPSWTKPGGLHAWLGQGGSTCQPVAVAPERESYWSSLLPPHFSAFLLLKRHGEVEGGLCNLYEGGLQRETVVHGWRL